MSKLISTQNGESFIVDDNVAKRASKHLWYFTRDGFISSVNNKPITLTQFIFKDPSPNKYRRIDFSKPSNFCKSNFRLNEKYRNKIVIV
jgi:hypothetical protein